jgi:ParB family protein of integrating conjugative element (PFGI_1 class)
MIKRGGNTRLEIMKMLYHETGDERFAMIDCLFKPWTSEADCIVGHLTENTTQGKMTLIDKARGYRQFKEEYEKEQGIENIGQRKLAALLKAKGASINHGALGIMNYALDVLEPAIPETLNRGLGKAQIEKLKRLHQTYERLAEAHNLYDSAIRDAQIRADFHQLLSDHDGDEWDMDLVIHEFRQRLGELLFDKVVHNRLMFDIEECLKRDPWKVELVSTQKDEPQPAETSSQIQGQGQNHPENTVNEQTLPPQTTSPANTKSTSSSTTKPEQNNDDQVRKIQKGLEQTFASQQQQQQVMPRLEIPDSSFTAGEFDIKSQRARIYTLALQFAKPHRLQTSLIQWNGGFGYFLDMPRTKLTSPKDWERTPEEDGTNQIVTKYLSKDREEVAKTMAWWLLFQAVGVFDHTTENLVPGYNTLPDCKMKEMLGKIYSLDFGLPPDRSPNMFGGTAYITLQTGEMNHLVDMALAFNYIKPAHMMKYIEMLEARTQLQAYVETNSINLWKEA